MNHSQTRGVCVYVAQIAKTKNSIIAELARIFAGAVARIHRAPDHLDRPLRRISNILAMLQN